MINHYIILCFIINSCFIFCNDYFTYERIDSTLQAWNNNYGYEPHSFFSNHGVIYSLDTIGYSSKSSLPIFAVKIASNANNEKQDKPRVLILGQCHAEEIYGIEISMQIIECYLDPEKCWDQYKNINNFLLNVLQISLEKVELWVVPTHNPEGLKVVYGYCDDGISKSIYECENNSGNWVEDRTYRKNISDANGNSLFIENEDWKIGVGYDMDGVDLNRNYDINWIFGHELFVSGNSCNTNYDDAYDYYRGSNPMSEKETQAIANFANSHSFILSIAYHSSRSGCVAEKVIFPWGWKDPGDSDLERKLSPDYSLIKNLGDKIHQILDFPNAGGAIPQGSRKGNAHDWLYRETGTIQYLIEVGGFNYNNGNGSVPLDYIDPADDYLIDNNSDKLHSTIENNLEAFYYLLINASAESNPGFDHSIDVGQVTGLVRGYQDSLLSGAKIQVLERDRSILKPRLTDSFGRYRRLLELGSSYTLIASYPGYISDTIIINNLVSGINSYNFNLERKSYFDLNINIENTVENIETVVLHYENSFKNNTMYSWPVTLTENFYTFRFEGVGLSPIIIETYLDQNMSYNLQFYEKHFLFQDNFIDLSKWEIVSGDWNVLDGSLKTQEELFYDNNMLYQIKTDLLSLDGNNSYIVKLNLRNELEWDKDFFHIIYLDNNKSDTLSSITGDKFEFYDLFVPLIVSSNEGSGQLLLSLETDYNLNYRGVEIKELSIVNSGDYSSNNLVDSEKFIPSKFELKQNYPNPFNPITKIDFSIPYLSNLKISVYNINGEFIELLIDDIYSAGSYSIDFDASSYSSGIYFYRLIGDKSNITKKFIIIK